MDPAAAAVDPAEAPEVSAVDPVVVKAAPAGPDPAEGVVVAEEEVAVAAAVVVAAPGKAAKVLRALRNR